MREWDRTVDPPPAILASLECERALPQRAGADVAAVLAVGGELWAGVESELVVWRRA